jgi:hypothetical protein
VRLKVGASIGFLHFPTTDRLRREQS